MNLEVSYKYDQADELLITLTTKFINQTINEFDISITEDSPQNYKEDCWQELINSILLQKNYYLNLYNKDNQLATIKYNNGILSFESSISEAKVTQKSHFIVSDTNTESTINVFYDIETNVTNFLPMLVKTIKNKDTKKSDNVYYNEEFYPGESSSDSDSGEYAYFS